MLNETMTFTLPDRIHDRIHRLMRLGGEAAAQDADAATYETLDVAATSLGRTRRNPDLFGEIARSGTLHGRPDAEQASETHADSRIWNYYQHARGGNRHTVRPW